MNILYMAYTEGEEIVELDQECMFRTLYSQLFLHLQLGKDAITQKLSNMYFLYGPTDRYTPRHFYEDIRLLYPSGKYISKGAVTSYY